MNADELIDSAWAATAAMRRFRELLTQHYAAAVDENGGLTIAETARLGTAATEFAKESNALAAVANAGVANADQRIKARDGTQQLLN